MQIASVQVAHSVDLLLQLCALWETQFGDAAAESGLVRDLSARIRSAVRKLGHNLVLFLQVRRRGRGVRCGAALNMKRTKFRWCDETHQCAESNSLEVIALLSVGRQ